jgi:hypothetical protein
MDVNFFLPPFFPHNFNSPQMSRHVIETDFEPDDLLQIRHHAKTNKGVHLTIGTRSPFCRVGQR